MSSDGTPGTDAMSVETRYGLAQYANPADTVPLEEFDEEISRKQPFGFRVDSLYSWRQQRFGFSFEFSNPAGRWHWVVTHLSAGREIIRDPVVVDYPYQYDDYLLFRFEVPSGRTVDRVDHTNLGSSVTLGIYPGPSSPQYPFDLEEA